MEQQNYINSVNLNQNTDFPYLVLNIVNDNSYPRNPGFQVMHWHEDLQFIYVLSGEIEVVTLETVVSLHPGEGVFINKNVVHLVRKKSCCHYNSFVFPDYFLKFYFGSPVGSTVDHVTENKNFPIFHIKGQKENQNVLDTLKKLTDLEQEKTPLYVYEVLTTLCTLWLELCRIVTLPQALSPKNVVEERMTIFLRYIEQHFSESISLNALAESTHVSKSECLRCFKSSLQTAPYQYLMESACPKRRKCSVVRMCQSARLQTAWGFHSPAISENASEKRQECHQASIESQKNRTAAVKRQSYLILSHQSSFANGVIVV